MFIKDKKMQYEHPEQDQQLAFLFHSIIYYI
jgi:hypothetical protein